ncbi:MarR family winged helix-turn-helix transcriptional regulator, partial [Nocardia sp. NPDC004722]
MADSTPDDVLRSRLGYLLKHAYHRLAEEIGTALRPLGIDSRELAVLVLLDDTDTPLSQLDLAQRLGIDRTTMTQFTDTLEAKGLLARRRSAEAVEGHQHRRHQRGGRQRQGQPIQGRDAVADIG